MISWERNVEYLLYDSSVFASAGSWDVREAAAREHGTLPLSDSQLALRTAQAAITRADKFRREVVAFARSYLSIMPFMLGEKDGFLAINKNNKDILRDFSKSTRHGEIAQGINYYFALKRLGAYAIYDFSDYAKNRIHIAGACRGRTPDYILCYTNGTIGILESKGTMAANPTRYLISAHEQCVSGRAYLEFNKVDVRDAYASAVSFATSSRRMKRNTCIYIADPEGGAQFRDYDFEKNSRYEYSKWFYLAGNRSATEKLMEDKPLSKQDFESYSDHISADGPVVGSWRMELPLESKIANRESEDWRTVKVSLGIIPFLQECLMKGRTFEYRDKVKDQVLLARMAPDSQRVKIFDDGTFIRID